VQIAEPFVRILGVIIVTIIFLLALGWAFGRHFIPDLKTLVRAEFRTKAGLLSFLGFLVLIYLAIHREALEYIIWLASPQAEREAVMEHISHSQTVMTISSSAVLIANLVLLAILGVSGTSHGTPAKRTRPVKKRGKGK
jgi:hypothetical protein